MAGPWNFTYQVFFFKLLFQTLLATIDRQQAQVCHLIKVEMASATAMQYIFILEHQCEIWSV